MDAKAYERWTKEETERLIEAHKMDVYELAKKFGRYKKGGPHECKREGATEEEELIMRCKSYAREIMKKLGKNMSESVYHNACIVKLERDKVAYKTEYNIPIIFEEVRIGTMRCDLLVDERVVVELKAKEKINENDKIQLRKYMRYLGVKRGLLINFGKGGRGVLQFVTMTMTTKNRSA